MNTHTQLQKIISILMSFILLIELTGCYSTRILTTSEINQSYYYLIHNKESIYTAYNLAITNGILSGSLDYSNKNFTDPKYSHIYLSSDSLLTFNNNQINLPVTSIKEIKQRVPDPGKTRTLKTVFILTGIVAALGGLSVLLLILGVNAIEDVGPEMGLCSPTDEP